MTQEELELDGKKYFSSKRAAQIMGYAQDYVGQICRSGVADCRRVNGLWHVTIESLEAHKKSAADIKARAFKDLPQANRIEHSETILAFSGEEYVSSKHGAEITGYNSDYVTQLARSGKIRARQVGSRWYVCRKDLLENKERNDALLAAVQAEASGVRRIDEKSREIERSRLVEEPVFTYIPESAPLVPRLNQKPSPETIRRSPTAPENPYEAVPPRKKQVIPDFPAYIPARGRKKSHRKLIYAVVLTLFLIVGTGAGFLGVKNYQKYVSRMTASGIIPTASLDSQSRKDFVTAMILLVTDVLHYERLR